MEALLRRIGRRPSSRCGMEGVEAVRLPADRAPSTSAPPRAATGFGVRWKAIVARLEMVPSCLSDLSSHPCFSKNTFCRELLQSVAAMLADAA